MQMLTCLLLYMGKSSSLHLHFELTIQKCICRLSLSVKIEMIRRKKNILRSSIVVPCNYNCHYLFRISCKGINACNITWYKTLNPVLSEITYLYCVHNLHTPLLISRFKDILHTLDSRFTCDIPLCHDWW